MILYYICAILLWVSTSIYWICLLTNLYRIWRGNFNSFKYPQKHDPYCLPRDKWPDPLHRYIEVKEVFVGCCPKYKSWDDYENNVAKRKIDAHAHVDGKYGGIICFKHKSLLKDKQTTVLHELAHLLTPDKKEDHGDKWRAKLLELGGTLKATHWSNSYHKNEIRRKLSNMFYPLI